MAQATQTGTGQAALDILGIGNAIVDVVASASEATLDGWGMAKGSMALIDTARAEAIHASLSASVQTGGGSAANTCAAAASLGARVGYLGKVADGSFSVQQSAHHQKALGVGHGGQRGGNLLSFCSEGTYTFMAYVHLHA